MMTQGSLYRLSVLNLNDPNLNKNHGLHSVHPCISHSSHFHLIPDFAKEFIQGNCNTIQCLPCCLVFMHGDTLRTLL